MARDEAKVGLSFRYQHELGRAIPAARVSFASVFVFENLARDPGAPSRYRRLTGAQIERPQRAAQFNYDANNDNNNNNCEPNFDISDCALSLANKNGCREMRAGWNGRAASSFTRAPAAISISSSSIHLRVLNNKYGSCQLSLVGRKGAG